MKYEKMTDELLIEKLRGGEKEIIDFLEQRSQCNVPSRR